MIISNTVDILKFKKYIFAGVVVDALLAFVVISEGKLSVMHSLRLGGKNSCENFSVHRKFSHRKLLLSLILQVVRMSSTCSSAEDKGRHLKLAGVVKGVHAKLRRQYKECKYTEHVNVIFMIAKFNNSSCAK